MSNLIHPCSGHRAASVMQCWRARTGTLLGMLPTVAPRESRLPHKLYVMDEGVFEGSCT